MYDPDTDPVRSAAYLDGHNAATRCGKYQGVAMTPKCPYPEGELADAWENGFGDGTEDFIADKCAD